MVRRSVSRRAAEAGLGRVRRVHRQHRGRPEAMELLPWLLGFVMAEGAVAAFDWRYALLLPVLVVAAIAGWVHFAPLPRPERPRRRFAVCDGGVLVLAPSTEPFAIPWDAITSEWGARGSVLRLGDGERTVFAGPVTAGRDLGRAVQSRSPVRARTAPRLAVGAAAAGTAALLGWIALPPLVPAVSGERPESLQDLARLCWRQDRPYERAASYEGTGPHPLVFFREGAGPPELAVSGADGRRPAPDEVQLVACSYPAGRVSGDPLKQCLYRGGLRTETFQGRHRLDVYEASTGRRVGRRMLSGTDRVGDCAPAKVVYGDPPHDEVRQGDTYPPMDDYDAALRPFLTGTPRS
ncbi:hypothetical protein ACN3XK_40535 [Actinomadura welshii]